MVVDGTVVEPMNPRDPHTWSESDVLLTRKSWSGMRARVKEVKGRHFANYMYREIDCDPVWMGNFVAFASDMGPRPLGKTLDRIDNNKGYWRWNCRWADQATQNANRRPESAKVWHYGSLESRYGLAETSARPPKVVPLRPALPRRPDFHAETGELPATAWSFGGEQDSGRLAWRYPLHLLFLGQAVFVADRGGLAEAALRAVLAYRCVLRERFQMRGGIIEARRKTVEGVPGLVIRRVE